MAMVNAVPYNYVPTAPRLKSTMPRYGPTQKQFMPSDIEVDSTRITAAVATAYDECYRPEILAGALKANDIRRGESYASDFASTSVLGLNKEIYAAGHEAWYNIKNDDFENRGDRGNEGDSKKKGKKRWHPAEIEIDSDNENDMDPRPAKQQKLSFAAY
ncbi:hypothetical protein SBOR_6249 [Sclerotinia borealis F-4128]|uniref:Uncharacterized protein n=1 Tax=Sclerotinia borealis (strain F-4128) TaxID=1432307 RepID=W9C9F3_SCLBF|nr:hypothetical protein SBOR_6249 [Sclerotinia borealis F-4128]